MIKTETVSELFIPSSEDTQVGVDHFEKPIWPHQEELYSLKEFLEKDYRILTVPIRESHFMSLEEVVQEMDDNFPISQNKLIEGLRQFKSQGFLPLVLYRKDGNGAEMYLGIQGHQREHPKFTQEELNRLKPEEIIKTRKGHKYESDTPEDIAREIDFNLKGSSVLQKLKERNIQPHYVLLTAAEYDQLERCLTDPKYRRDTLGQIDEADSGKKTLWKLLERAVSIGATDLHIEPWSEKEAYARYRIDSDLHPEKIPRRSVPSIVSSLKVMAKMDLTEKRKALEGGIHFVEGDNITSEELEAHPTLRSYNLRIETLPTVNGEAASVRFLPQNLKNIRTLEDLGFEPEHCQTLREVSSNRQGFIIVTGPTGSGKTTTLYSILDGINKPDIRIVTVENPVEYRLKGLIQTEVNEKAGYDFSTAVPAFLRADPNVILVGEMRDEKTREAAVQLAQTGHLLFATLHTNDAPSAIKRLFDLKATPSDLQESLSTVVAQRLARKLCIECKASYNGREQLNKLFGEDMISREILLYKPAGKKDGLECKTCLGAGYKGRVVVPSVWVIGEESRELFDQPYSYPRVLDRAVKDGMEPLVVSGIKRVLAGVTSLEDLDGRVVNKGAIRTYKNKIINLINEYSN